MLIVDVPPLLLARQTASRTLRFPGAGGVRMVSLPQAPATAPMSLVVVTLNVVAACAGAAASTTCAPTPMRTVSAPPARRRARDLGGMDIHAPRVDTATGPCDGQLRAGK